MTTREPTSEEYVRSRIPHLQVCDWPEGCKEYATIGLMRTTPKQEKIYRCEQHKPKRRSNWARAFQYGIPEVGARYPGVFFESLTIRHPLGATLEARQVDSVFTYGEVSRVIEKSDAIDELLKEHGLEDWDWQIVVPGVGEKAPTHRFESGDPELYTHCQACGESVEGQKAYWCYGQYHPGGCYDSLFADCLACGKHCMDARTNMSPRAHLRPIYAAQLCNECLHQRWRDKAFRAFIDQA